MAVQTDQNEYVEFGNRLQALRVLSGMSQKQLADALNLPQQTYQGYESGIRKVTLQLLKIFSEHFRVSVDFLAGNIDYKDPAYRDVISKVNKGENLNKNEVAIFHEMANNSLEPEKNNGSAKERPNIFHSTFVADRLRHALTIKDMKPIELSEKTGIPKSSISQYMSGYAQPKQDRIYLIAKSLGVSEAWLMGYDVPMERSQTPPSNWIMDGGRITSMDGLPKEALDKLNDYIDVLKKAYGIDSKNEE